MNPEHRFNYLLQNLKDTYGLSPIKVADGVYDVAEGTIGIFQLIYGKTEKSKDKILISIHLDTDPIDAIQWYLRVKDMCPDLYLTSSHYKDDYGETFMGQSAHIIREYKVEQRVISQWDKGEKETKEFIESKISGRDRTTIPNAFIDETEALREFNKMQKDDEEKYH